MCFKLKIPEHFYENLPIDFTHQVFIVTVGFINPEIQEGNHNEELINQDKVYLHLLVIEHKICQPMVPSSIS
jgi:hypothetical protein